MRWLKRDDGAAAVLVALLMVPLLGFVAVVVDVGNLFWEKRMLQNSADAAALAVAQDCAAGDCGTYDATAETYALENNHRGAHVEDITPAALDPSSGKVTVTVRTGETDGTAGTLSHFFAGILGQDVGVARARATAVWGAINVADSELPLTVSWCDWEAASGADPDNLPSVSELKADQPGSYHGTTRGEVLIFHNSSDAHNECSVQPGFDADGDEVLPAGWGWLAEDEAVDCAIEKIPAEEDEHFWAYKDPGNDPKKHCLDDALGRAVVIPIFIDFERGNPRDRYLLYAPAAFYLTGYRFPSMEEPVGDAPCAPPDTCISGHFVQKSEAEGDVTGDIDLGVHTVLLTE